MADPDLPPLAELPDSSVVPQGLMDQLQHSADWASTFGGSDTNIAQRARHNDDIHAYADALNQARSQAQQQLLQTNQTAQNFAFRTQQLQHKEQMDAANLQIQGARLQAQQATERLKAVQAISTARDTAGFNQGMSDFIVNGGTPHSKEWNSNVAQLLAAFPHVDQRDVAKFGASLFPGENLTPQEILGKVQEIQSQNPNAQVTVNGKGQASVVAKPTGLNPMHQVSAISNQMKDDRLRSSELEKQIGKLQEDHPWLKTTTGPFDAEGKQYFGNSLPTDKLATLPQVTPSTKAAFDRYNSALQEQAIIAARHQNLQQKMSSLYTGDVSQPETTQAAQPAPLPATPDVGYVRGGFRFKGGDPKVQANWEKLGQ